MSFVPCVRYVSLQHPGQTGVSPERDARSQTVAFELWSSTKTSRQGRAMSPGLWLLRETGRLDRDEESPGVVL
jgi:hypothetical protein